MPRADLVVLGGGIVGLATAWRYVERFPGRTVTVVEKESTVAAHQTGRNSGVLHSGIYYRPGSLRAENCRDGKLAMQQFCDEHAVPYDLCGKVIVAVSDSESPALDRILERGRANRVECEMIDRDRLNELEPHTAGVRAIHVPEAGIVDYAQVCRKLAELLEASGGSVRLGEKVVGLEQQSDRVLVRTSRDAVEGRIVVNATGLHSDRTARLSGAKPDSRIVPFRGEYYELKPEAWHLCRGLIYPVPDPRFPFLGVHFTRMIQGGVECGPNAVLAFAREGYHRTDINIRDLWEALTYRGFQRMALKYWRTGLTEMLRSVSKRAFVRALQRLIPDITSGQLEAAPAGVRAQALNPSGDLVDDFLIDVCGRVVNILNAPSPAATASLNVGRLVVDRVEQVS